MNPLLTVVIAAISGGGLIQLLNWWSNRKTPKYSMDKALRDELRGSIQELTTKVKEQDLRIDALETEAAGWQSKALQWYQRYKLIKIKALDVLVSHGVPIAEAQLALKEDNEEWMP